MAEMKIEIHPLKKNELKPLFTNPNELGFCKLFTDRMFVMNYTEVDGWHNPVIKKLAPFQMEPSTIVLHYAQEIFEGLKAFRTKKGEINLFRPEMNAKRFNRSAARMCMPAIPEFDFLESIETLVRLEERWVPAASTGASLYIRPFMFACDTTLGVRASSAYTYCVILSPVGPYYAEGFNPISLYVSDEYTRAARGGTGEAKTGGNYAASLLAGRVAREKGCAQVLWLDGAEHRFVEEVGAMNIFFVFGDRLVTPALNGSILPGITRDSVLVLAREQGLKVEERPLPIDEVIGGITTGSVTEIFGSGTAASISPVGSLRYRDQDYVVGGRKVGPVSKKLYDLLRGIQYGEIEDRHGWIRKVALDQHASA
ncbi:MAG: Branched-chain amino acid aminotransferase [Candidatus Ozemobacter sibiricus]|uniref:Branched-chain-amino-acid aminotransferase n=1 Tax=Candidatus Ozemobacter sibiricus TaxID=2268124 RepID=A0A367ZSW3_9BACT|nr:MAG: Branched-chain amino acid aminotransferase [Candidatus Ozemobacter sibiricus]